MLKSLRQKLKLDRANAEKLKAEVSPRGSPCSRLLRGGAWQQFSLWRRWERRVRAPGLQDGGFAGDVGRVPSPGGGRQGYNENCWVLGELRHRSAAHGTDERFDLLDFAVTETLGGRGKGWKSLGRLNCFRRFDRTVHSLFLGH